MQLSVDQTAAPVQQSHRDSVVEPGERALALHEVAALRGARGSELGLEGAILVVRGAVLDVFSTEPLPGESPLWHLSQVLLTPHVSAVSPEGFWERGLELFLDNWRRHAAGEPLRNRVDKLAGY